MKNEIRMKSKWKFNKGITLIALVITIIVLLILAGVAITTLTGENGVLSKAITAKKNTKRATAKERIQVEVIGSYGEDEKPDLDILKANLSTYIPEAIVEGDTFPLTVTLDGDTFTIDAKGNVEFIEPKTEFEAGDIANDDELFQKVAGGVVTNYEDRQDIEWKVFYADTNGIYLIASDYVPVSKLTEQKSTLGFTDDGSYNIFWSSSSSFKVTSIDSTVASRFMLNQLSTFDTTNPNYKMTACLIDATKWNTFRDARWVDENDIIGSPTLEMYVASWNKKYPSNKLYTRADSTGYYVGTSANPTSYGVGMSGTPGQSDTLYYPHTGPDEWNGCRRLLARFSVRQELR